MKNGPCLCLQRVEINSRNERQQRKLVEIEAVRQALEQQVGQTKAAFERQVLSDLSDAQKKVEQLEQGFIKACCKTSEQILRAPIECTVRQLALHTVGGVVTPAQQLMVIVPADSHLEAEAMIANRDIGFVSVGQVAEIKIDTYNFTRYGLLHVRVATVSRDAIVRDKPNEKPDTSKSGGALSNSSEPEGQEFLYSARVPLDETQMQVEDKLVNLSPGQWVRLVCPFDRTHRAESPRVPHCS